MDRVTNTVDKLAEVSRKGIEGMEGCKKAESDVQEGEVTAAVVQYYGQEGFEVVKLPIKEVFNKQGEPLTDLDGFLSISRAGHESVVLIEAKHQVNLGKINKKAQTFHKVEQLMADLRDSGLPASGPRTWRLTAGQLWQFRDCDTTWFMAGALLSRELRDEARALGFRLVVTNGSRCTVLP